MTEEKEMWTIDELVAMTEKVQHKEIEWAGKALKVQWCELTEAEEPKAVIPDDGATEEEKNAVYQQIGVDKVKAMITKADEMNPDDACGLVSVWEDLPTTLRYQLTAEVLGAKTPDF